MSFEEFTDYIFQNILTGWREEDTVTIQKTRKNNGVLYTGIYIRRHNQAVTPAIYLESYYERYCQNNDMEEIIHDIREEFNWAIRRISDCKFDISTFDKVKDRIIYRLINYDKNLDLLSSCPHIRLYDLAVTFRWLAHEDSAGISTALITHKEMKLWKVTLPDILLAAQSNTRRLFPGKIIHMDDLLTEILPGISCKDEQIPMYIITNEQQINGATSILYENLMKDFTREHPGNYFILPSSIHEMILIPEDRIRDSSVLKDIVPEVNKTVVSEGDVLSDSVYYYNMEQDTISVF